MMHLSEGKLKLHAHLYIFLLAISHNCVNMAAVGVGGNRLNDYRRVAAAGIFIDGISVKFGNMVGQANLIILVHKTPQTSQLGNRIERAPHFLQTLP